MTRKCCFWPATDMKRLLCAQGREFRMSIETGLRLTVALDVEHWREHQKLDSAVSADMTGTVKLEAT